MDTADFKILKAIADLKVPYPKADKINSLANSILGNLERTWVSWRWKDMSRPKAKRKCRIPASLTAYPQQG
jgi:hypothetical protein